MDAPTPYDRIGGHDGLALLLRRFYADVRQHAEIGDWPAHLEKIADFCSGLTGGPALYGSGMTARHIPLRLEEAHLQAWLGLWQHHYRAHLTAAEAEDMIAITAMHRPHGPK